MIYNWIIPNVLMLTDFYSKEDCQYELDYATAAGFTEQNYSSSGMPEARYRAVKDDPVRAAAIWDRIKFIPVLDSFYQNLRPESF